MLVLGISGSLTAGRSTTRAALDLALEGAGEAGAHVRTDVLDLRDFALEFCDGRPVEAYGDDTRRALALVEGADAYVVATPMYRASYTGALKNLLDLVPNDPGGADPLRGKAVGLVATGGSHHHFLALEHELRPLFGFFGSQTLNRAVYVARGDLTDERTLQGPRVEELRALGRELVALAGLLLADPAGFPGTQLQIRRG